MLVHQFPSTLQCIQNDICCESGSLPLTSVHLLNCKQWLPRPLSKPCKPVAVQSWALPHHQQWPINTASIVFLSFPQNLYLPYLSAIILESQWPSKRSSSNREQYLRKIPKAIPCFGAIVRPPWEGSTSKQNTRQWMAMSLRNLSGAWWQMFIAKIQSLNPGPRLSVQREDQFFSASPKFFQWYTQYSKDLQARNSHTLPTGTWRGRAPINSIAKRSSCEVQSCSGHCHWVELTLCQIPHRSRSVPQISRDFVWSSKTL